MSLSLSDEASERNSAEEWYKKGVALAGTNKLEGYSAALKCFDRAIEIDPTNADYWNLKGNMYTVFDDWYSAIKCYDKAIELEPDNGGHWASKGSCHERIMLPLDHTKQDHRAIATECYEKAVSLSPKQPYGWVKKIQRLERMGRYHEALQACDLMILVLPDYSNFAWIHKGNALYSISHYEKAIENYDKVLQQGGPHHEAQEGKNKALEALSRNQE